MTGSINKVILVGNLGKTPEVRHAQDGAKVVAIALATSETWKDRTTGERRERTEWHRVVIFNERLGEFAEKYLKKGSKVYLEGQIQTRKWTDQNNQERYTTEVILSKFRGELVIIDSRSESVSNDKRDFESPTSEIFANKVVDTSSVNYSPLQSDLDDEIPF